MRLVRTMAAIALAALGTAGCTPDFVKGNQADALFRIQRIVGVRGSGRVLGNGDVLYSDVNDGFPDNASITMDVARKNPSVGSASPLGDVLLERYECRFVRTDGRSVEGVDVPFTTTGPMSGIMHLGAGVSEATITVQVPIVRHQAKNEPPLKNLWGIFPQQGTLEFPSIGIVNTIAEITVHARTVNGRPLTASGRLQVVFADFVDQ